MRTLIIGGGIVAVVGVESMLVTRVYCGQEVTGIRHVGR
jgi:hypothetical protein